MTFRLRPYLAIFVLAALTLLIFNLASETAPSQKLTEVMRAFGLREGTVVFGVDGNEPEVLRYGAKSDQPYHYYSLSKPITATAALRLADLGVLGLDDEVEGATLRQLLQHTGGWDQSVLPDPVFAKVRPSRCIEVQPIEKQFTPGARQVYPNLGYCLAGRYMERKAAKPLEQVVRDVIPQTRNMTYDSYYGPAGGWSGTAEQYWRFASRPIDQRMLAKPEGSEYPYYG